MRDFMYSEISAWHGIPNVPDNPDLAIEAGSALCKYLLEPLKDIFGHVSIRSAFRCAAVNDYGNKNGLNCASNEKDYARHIWDQGPEAELEDLVGVGPRTARAARAILAEPPIGVDASWSLAGACAPHRGATPSGAGPGG